MPKSIRKMLEDIIPTQQRMAGRHCRWFRSWRSVSDLYHIPPDVDDLKAGISMFTAQRQTDQYLEYRFQRLASI